MKQDPAGGLASAPRLGGIMAGIGIVSTIQSYTPGVYNVDWCKGLLLRGLPMIVVMMSAAIPVTLIMVAERFMLRVDAVAALIASKLERERGRENTSVGSMDWGYGWIDTFVLYLLLTSIPTAKECM